MRESSGSTVERTPRKIIRWLLIAIVLGAVGFTFAYRRRPVLMSFYEPGGSAEQPIWVIMNPLRDTASEDAAEAVLRQLRSGEQQELLESLKRYSDSDSVNQMIASEYDHRLREWKLVTRTDSGPRVTLFYRVLRADSGAQTPLWMTMKQIDGRWSVVDFATSR